MTEGLLASSGRTTGETPATGGATPGRPSPGSFSRTNRDRRAGASATTRPARTPSCADELATLCGAADPPSVPTATVARISERQPGGWRLATEQWPTALEYEVVLDEYLSPVERSVHDELNARARRTWLLGRIAAKDAVTQWHEDRRRIVRPSTVIIANDDDGRPFVATGNRAGDPDLRISIAHLPWAAVALVAEGYDVGIDIEEIAERPPSFVRVAFTADERAERAAGGGAHESLSDALWMAAAWCAKEATGKAGGTGLQGRPSAFVTRLVARDLLVVRDRLVRWQVIDPRVLRSVAGRALVVGWTLAPRGSDTDLDLDLDLDFEAELNLELSLELSLDLDGELAGLAPLDL